MSNDKNLRYFTFPIPLLDGAFVDIQTVCNNIIDYAIYNNSLKLYLGSEKENMQSSLKFYAVSTGSIERMTKKGKELVNSIPERTPLTSINRDTVFVYLKNEKTEFDIACLLAFASVKSILGKKEYCKTNKELIIARMFGYNSTKDIPKKKHPLFNKYCNRYHIDKILLELQYNWNLKLFSSHCRGFYLSFEYTLEQLAKINVDAKKGTKLNTLRDAKKEALKKAKEDNNFPIIETKPKPKDQDKPKDNFTGEARSILAVDEP